MRFQVLEKISHFSRTRADYSEQELKLFHEVVFVSPAGDKILPFPIFRRSEQIGMIQRNLPGRWLALLLMGSVGAAWALNPGPDEAIAPPLPASKMVVEGDPQVLAQLMGSLLGEVALSQEDRGLLGAADRRVVLQSKLVPGNPLRAQREKAEFMRTVEEVEAEYVVGGRYPALPRPPKVPL